MGIPARAPVQEFPSTFLFLVRNCALMVSLGRTPKKWKVTSSKLFIEDKMERVNEFCAVLTLWSVFAYDNFVS